MDETFGHRPRGHGRRKKKLLRGGESLLFHRIALDLGRSVKEVKSTLSSQEITDWHAYYQVSNWIRKADTDDPKKALAFAKEVHRILLGRGE